MNRKNILVLDGSPKATSLSGALAANYADAAKDAGHVVRHFHLSSMAFDPDLPEGYTRLDDLPPVLQEFQQGLRWANHLVFAYPVWWGSVPARLKGLIDRTLLPGFAFRYERGQTFPDQLLKGRSARLLVCMDTPPWYFRWFQGAPAHRMMNDTVLGFCGVKPVRISSFGPVIHSTPEKRARWLETATALGREAR